MVFAPADAGISHGLVLGIIYGLIHIVGPDHLGTLLTLSTAASTPKLAFFFAGSWALGHSFGMVIIAAIFLALGRCTHMDIENYEHYGDYVVGASLMLCAIYFIVRESEFLRANSDGTHSLQGCRHCCDSDSVASAARSSGSSPGSPGSSRRVRFICQDGKCEDKNCQPGDHDEKAETEQSPLLSKPQPQQQEMSWWSYLKGGAFGIVQGICCPMGILGVSFVTALHPGGVIVFVLVFVCGSTLGTATLAWVWSSFTGEWARSSLLSPQRMYRLSCFVTFALGLAWIIVNAAGALDRLNYSHHMHGHVSNMEMDHNSAPMAAQHTMPMRPEPVVREMPPRQVVTNVAR